MTGIAAATTWIVPYHLLRIDPQYANSGVAIEAPASFNGLVPLPPLTPADFSPLACSVLVFRNWLYLGLVAWVGILLVQAVRRDTPASEVGPAAPPKSTKMDADRGEEEGV